MNRFKKNTISGITQLVILLYSLRICLPAYGFYMPAVVNAALLAFLYVSLFVGKTRLRSNDFFSIIPLFSIYILSLFYDTPSDWPTYIYSLAQTFVYPLLGLYFMKSDDKIAARRLFYIMLFSLGITCITTYIGCQTYPQASRALATMSNADDEEFYALYTSMNIGGFLFTYTLVLIVPLLIYLLRDKKINIIIGSIALIMVVMTILITEYTIAMLFLIIAFIAFFYPKSFGVKHILLTIIVTFIIFFSVKDFVGQAFGYMASSVKSELISERLNSISIMFLQGEQSVEGDAEVRVEIYRSSIDAFTDSPIWGSSDITVGGHSYVLDNLGKYGLLGLIAMIIMYNTMYKLYYKPNRRQTFSGYMMLTFSIAVALAILNPKENLALLTYIVPLFAVSNKTDVR